jgi:hypothetical protein
MKGEARAHALKCSRLIEQVLRIIIWIAAVLNDGGIAGLLREHCQLSFQPPSQGMEPEDGAIEGGQPLKQWITAAGVFPFVSEYGLQFIRWPIAPGQGQDDGGLEPADGDRAYALRAGEELLLWRGALQKGCGPVGADEKPGKEDADSGEIDGEEDIEGRGRFDLGHGLGGCGSGSGRFLKGKRRLDRRRLLLRGEKWKGELGQPQRIRGQQEHRDQDGGPGAVAGARVSNS